jgi:F420H(2)-dependent quinone reductase
MESGINQLAESAVRAGFLAPCYVGLGLVVIETKGRKTGEPRSVPVLANRVGRNLFVSTVRENSQWVRNLVADDAPSVVVSGIRRSVSVTSRRVGPWTGLRLELAGTPHVA